MGEYQVYVKPKEPVTTNYEHNELLWTIKSNFKSNGGIPTIVGVVYVRKEIRYKVEFPNGMIDYFRLDNFDKFYELTTEKY